MAMIRPETEMKDSGIKWVGLMPVNWKTVRIKNLPNQEENSFVDGDWIESSYITDSGIRYYTTGNIGDGKFKEQGNGYISENTFNELKCKYAFPGDLVLSRLNEPYGRSCIIPETEPKCIVAVDNVILRTNEDKRYICYITQCDGYHAEVGELARGTAMKRVSRTNLGTIRIPLPAKIEQQSIADYLDEICSKIDEIIAEAKASIDEYKELKQSVIDKAVLHGLCNGMMKDSGNDLIGKIPLSWEMRKLKYVADFNPGITTAYDAQKEVGYVPMNCVKNGYMNPLSARLSDMSTGLTGFQDGDIVIAKVTPCFENGNIAVAENLEQGVAFGSSELFVIRTHSINRRFMLYYLQNSVFKNQCISTMTGTGGLKRVSGYFVNNAYITYPPENEQQVIVNYLDEAVKNMDSLITEKESLINDLEAYKKSLIYEVVTGKRRVV